MHWFPQLYIVLNLLGAIVCTALAITVPQKRETADQSFQIFIATLGLWCLISGLFFFNYSIEDFWIWNGLLVFPYVTIPVLWLNFVADFTLSKIPKLRYLFIIPSFTFFVYWFKPISHWMWTLQNYRIQWGVPMVDFERGLWFRFIYIPYSYCLVLVSLALLIKGYLKAHQSFKQLHLILIGINLITLTCNGITITSAFDKLSFYDLTPLAYTFSSLVFCLAISHYRLLHRSPLAYQTIFSSLQTSILVFDNNQQLVEANPAASRLLNLNSLKTETPFSNLLFFIPSPDLEELKHRGQIEARYGNKHLEIMQHPIQEKGKDLGKLITIKDITQARQLEQQLLEGALLYDALTNLPNRTLFQDRLQQAIKYTQRHPETHFAVLFLDLDRFKIINDSLGHAAGDEILMEIAQRLTQCLRGHDTVARLGGDEFAILAERITADEVQHLCQRIQQNVQQPISFLARDLQISVSIGVAFNHKDLNADQLLRNADLAMYQTKANGKANFTTYDHLLHQQLINTMQLEVDLKNAFIRQEFYVEFQPIISLGSNQISGFEALVRWQHPLEGCIYPLKFIDLAEEIGLIGDLDLWVLDQACQQLAQWNQYFPCHPLTISINLSVANFNTSHLTSIIANTLAKHQILGSQLKFEITESLLMENPNVTTQTLSELKQLGIGIQLDDFGTGHSSLSYLHQLPLDALKIDRTFVLNAPQSKESQTIIKSIVDLAHNLQLQVIGEGVESELQEHLLKDLGCAYGQGFFWNKPQSAEQATRLVSQQLMH